MNKNLNRSKNVKDLYIFLLTFFMIYGPRIKIEVPLLNDTMLSATIIALLYLIALIIIKKQRINIKLLSLYSLLLSLTIYSFIIVWINGFNDTFVFLRNARSLFAFWGIIGLAYLLINSYGNRALSKAVNLIFLSGVVHALIMWMMLASGSFREVIHQLVSVDLYEREILNIVRVSGLMAQGGDGASLVQGMVTLTSPIVINEKKGIKKVIYFILFVLLWSSSFLSARIGFVLSSILLPIVYFITKDRLLQNIGKIKKDTFRIIGVILLLIIAIPIIIPENIVVNLFNYYDSPIYRLMEPIRTFSETGRFATRSTSRLFGNMIIFPTSATEMIFGSSNMGRSSNLPYIPSDIGYIRLLFAMGIIGSVLLYSFFIISNAVVKKSVIYEIKYQKLFTVLICYTLIGHIKMVFALSRNSFTITILLLGLIVIMSNKHDTGKHI